MVENVQVIGHNPGSLKLKHFDHGRPDGVYSLASCVDRSSVHKHYSDSGTDQLAFEMHDNQAARSILETMKTGDYILFGDDIFVISQLTVKEDGYVSASITADQYINVMMKRIIQPRYLQTVKSSTEQPSKVYMTALEALASFQHGIKTEGIVITYQGYFPRRPMSNLHFYTGSSLLSQLRQVYPGITFIQRGKRLTVQGFQKTRDDSGALQPVREIFTGQRFNEGRDLINLDVKTDETQICNAIRVKAAMKKVQKVETDDAELLPEEEELNQHFSEMPYFTSFLAYSRRSVDEYGLRESTSTLDDFTTHAAGAAAAREHMITDPVVTITGTLIRPGRTILEPTPGLEYMVGSTSWDHARKVKLTEYDWYPYDSSKGTAMTFASVASSLRDAIGEIAIHDWEQSPEATDFKEIEEPEVEDKELKDDDDDDDDDSSSGDDDPTDDDNSDDTDESDDRPDDDGSGGDGSAGAGDNASANGAGAAHLPISDVGTNAHISRYGNLTVNAKNNSYDIRVTNDQTLQHLRDGQFTSDDAKNSNWTHLFKIDYHYKGSWIGGDKSVKKYYHQADYYLGQLVLTNAGGLYTTSGSLTVRTGVADSDFDKNGLLKRVWHKSGNVNYIDEASDEQPGKLGTIQAGKLVALESKVYHYVNHSQLSLKENLVPLSKEKALETILKTDIATYNFKGDQSKEPETSVVIDDVHDKPEWSTPKEFITKDGKSRKDSVQIGYLIKAVQAQQDQIETLKGLVNKQSKQIDALKDKISD